MTSLLKDSELCSFYRLSNVNDVQYWSEAVPEADAAIVPTISNAAMPSLDNNNNSNNNNNKNEGLQLVMESVSDYKEYTYEQMFTELVERLELETSKQEISLRELVKDCFDEFVMAKGSVDSVYANILSKQQQQQQQQVKGRLVQPQSQSSSIRSGESELSHALLDVNSSVTATLQYMSGMYSPIIDRRLKVRSLRHSIGTLSKYSYLFNLPIVIQSFIQSGYKSSSLFGNVELQRLELLISDIARGEEQISANEDASLKCVYSQVG
ncbi:hypothetical protein MIR68_012556, partial [Amoeboaphelidium protococcarum]